MLFFRHVVVVRQPRYICIYLGGRTSDHHTTQKKHETTSLDTFRNSVFVVVIIIINLAPGQWDHARLVLWDAQSQNQEKLGWGPPYFCR